MAVHPPARVRLRRLLGLWVPLLAVAITALATVPLPHGPGGCGIARANAVDLSDLCFRFQVSATNNTGSDLTDYGIRFEVNASQLISANRMQDHGFDLRPVNTALSPMEIVAQDLDSSPAGWWLLFDSIPDTETASAFVYSGNQTAKRNPGFFMIASSDTATAPDDAELDITDNLELEVNVNTSDTTQDAYFIDKWTGSTGYRFGLNTAGELLAQVDGATLSADASDWDGTLSFLRMRYASAAGDDLFIEEWDGSAWTTLASADTDAGAISTNSEPLELGTSFTGVLTDATIFSGSGTAGYAKVAQWGFAPLETAETSSACTGGGACTGTISDEVGDHDVTYSLSRDQSNISVSVGAVSSTSAGTVLSFTESSQDVLGDPATTDLFTRGGAPTNLPFLASLQDLRSDVGMTVEAWWYTLIAVVSGIVGYLAVRLTGMYETGAAIVVIGFSWGAVIGLVTPYVAVVVGMTAVAIWLANRQVRV